MRSSRRKDAAPWHKSAMKRTTGCSWPSAEVERMNPPCAKHLAGAATLRTQPLRKPLILRGKLTTPSRYRWQRDCSDQGQALPTITSSPGSRTVLFRIPDRLKYLFSWQFAVANCTCFYTLRATRAVSCQNSGLEDLRGLAVCCDRISCNNALLAGALKHTPEHTGPADDPALRYAPPRHRPPRRQRRGSHRDSERQSPRRFLLPRPPRLRRDQVGSHSDLPSPRHSHRRRPCSFHRARHPRRKSSSLRPHRHRRHDRELRIPPLQWQPRLPLCPSEGMESLELNCRTQGTVLPIFRLCPQYGGPRSENEGSHKPLSARRDLSS